MAASKSTDSFNSTGNLNFGIGSGGDSTSSSFSTTREQPGWNSNSLGSSFLDDHDGLLSTDSKKTHDFGPPKYTNQSDRRGGVSSTSSFDYDKPVYDDGIFEGVLGMKSSSSVKHDDVFSSISSPPKQSAPYDDLLGNFSRTEPELKSSSGKRSEELEKDVSDFDDLIPGFGGISPPQNRATPEVNRPQQSNAPLTKSTPTVMEDPFVIFESTSSPAYTSSGLFTDPLEQINNSGNSGSAKVGSSASRGIFDDLDSLDGLGKSVPMKSKGKDRSPFRSGPTMSTSKESMDKPSKKTSENTSHKKVHNDNYHKSHQTLFDMPTVLSDSHNSFAQTGSRSSYANADSNEKNSRVYMSPRSGENVEAAEDIWLTVSEIPLFTQPTSAPPPSRPPPPKPVHVSKADKSTSGKNKVNDFSSFPRSTQNVRSSKSIPDMKGSGISSIDEIDDFAMGRPQNNVDERADALSGVKEADANSAAAASAMKEAVDRAETKFKHAKEVRERENVKAAKSREAAELEKDDKPMQEYQEREVRAKEERLGHESEQKEREEKEREQRKLENARERAREIERERVKGRQAVERATKEARERAAAEARLKAERAAVGKAHAEARERAERAAVQRAQAEARARAAVDARERAERAATESRERAAAEVREEAQERASVARAEAEVRLRAERASVERAAAEARERLSAKARERAATVARENQQKNENDLESFFSMGSRPSSAPRPRATTPDSIFDNQFQSKGESEGARRTSVGNSSSIRRASSTTNIVDDLTSIFGGAPSLGQFQDIEGENEGRRGARLERHQRTQERATKALAEKNQRDLQTQREQAERHRISETLDVEIKRWAAGKEGNLRALLSTLQYVLWPECGWQPVSLTDLITAASVKKVYRKATLCIHPDKVQQKGANLQQKCIAEKVFDLLKDAWNKFNSEELF